MFFRIGSLRYTAIYFSKATLIYEDEGDRSVIILERAEYIAKTKETRVFPWRYFLIDENDLIKNTMTYKLARPKDEGADFSWLKPGVYYSRRPNSTGVG